MTSRRRYTAGFLFSGSGPGARGFCSAKANVQGHTASFDNLGGVDIDPDCCRDFEFLTGAPALQADISTLQPDALVRFWGPRRPDAVFLSPPCKGLSKLLPTAAAKTDHYQRLNALVFQGVSLVCAAYRGDPPPLIVLENVPGITSRGAAFLNQVRGLLRAEGYLLHEATHDCGEVGGLAQHRDRFLLVARRPQVVRQYVYQPRKKRVRGVGEVLAELPLPGDPAAGPLHALPRLSWLNWVRLALIPAGGDWRDLPTEAQLRATAASAGSFNGHPGLFGLLGWGQPAKSITGNMTVSGSNTPAAVADPRIAQALALLNPVKSGMARRDVHPKFAMRGWDQPAFTVTGGGVGQVGGFGVADPRLYLDPSAIQMTCTPRAGAWGVLGWEEAACTITGSGAIDNSRLAVADPRAGGDLDGYPIIIAADGTWHRPLTLLERAALQGFPVRIGGKPLTLSRTPKRKGGMTGPGERIGNAVPAGAAEAVAGSLLRALLSSDLGVFSLGMSDEPVWVEGEQPGVSA